MPLVEFTGQSVQDSSNVQANPGRLINCYRELVMQGGKTTHVLRSVLGMDLKSDIGAAAVRAMGRGNQKSWVVGDSKLWELANDGTLTNRGTVADGANAVVEGNYSDVTVTIGGTYHVWDGSTISTPTGGAFTSVGSHCYVNGYTLMTEQDGKRFQWSDQGDATTLNALWFASAEKVDDNAIRPVEVNGGVVIFCERSAELWQTTGLADSEAFAFVTSWSVGLRSHNLLVKMDDTVFWVGSDNNVYIGVGSGMVDVTHAAVNTALENNDPTHCLQYEDRGHKFVAIIFSDRPAWVYDIKMREWHERAEGAGDGPWRATASVLGSDWMVGNTVGEIYTLTRINKDLNGPLRRTAISNTIYQGEKFIVPMVEVNGNVGNHDLSEAVDYALDVGGGFALKIDTNTALKVDSVSGDARAATLTLYESGDGGETWTSGKARSMGLSGDYTKRMTWRARGQFRQYTAKLVISEPADLPINSTAYVELA